MSDATFALHFYRRLLIGTHIATVVYLCSSMKIVRSEPGYFLCRWW